EARRAEARLPRGGWPRDGRQLVSAERRRRRGAAHLGGEGQGAGPEAARPSDRLGDERARARDHGRGADRRHPQRAEARRDDHAGHRRGGAKRGVRRAGDHDNGEVRDTDGEDIPAWRWDGLLLYIRHDLSAYITTVVHTT